MKPSAVSVIDLWINDMKRKPFFWSIFPAFVFITFISGLLIIIFSVKTFKQIYADFIYEKMVNESLLVKAYLDRTDETELVKLDSIVTGFASGLSSRITIIDEAGTVLADSREKASEMENHLDRPEFRKAVYGETGRSVRFSSTLKKELMYTAMPVFTSNGKKYIVRMAYPLMSFSDTIGLFTKKILWIVSIVLIMLAAVSMYLSKRLSAPLIQLKDKAKKIAEGNFKQDIEDYSHYETIQLSESMNFMAVELEDKISHLEFKNSEQSAILKSMVEGVIAIDMNDRILLINDAACRILSADHCKASGKLIQETIRNTKIQEFITSLVKSRLSISDKKELQLNSEGHDIFVQIQGSPLQNAKG